MPDAYGNNYALAAKQSTVRPFAHSHFLISQLSFRRGLAGLDDVWRVSFVRDRSRAFHSFACVNVPTPFDAAAATGRCANISGLLVCTTSQPIAFTSVRFIIVILTST